MFVEYPSSDVRTPLAEPASPRPEDATSSFAREWRGRDVLYGLALAALGVFAAVAAIGGLVAIADLDDASLDAALVVATMLFELALGLAVFVLARARGISVRDVGFRRPRRWGPLVVAWLGAYMILSLYAVSLALLEALGVDISILEGGNALPVSDSVHIAVLVGLGISVVVLAPFCEELFFRSLVYGGLRQTRFPRVALPVSGVLFGAFHFALPVLIPFAMIGVLFAWANERTDSLWTSIAAHGAFNGLSFALAVSGVAQ